MRALTHPLALALSIVVVGATIGFTGCGSSTKSTTDGGLGGLTGTIDGGGTGGSSSGAGGNTGAGGHVDAGSDVHTGAGGARADSGSGLTCAGLLACCNMAPAGQLKTLCMAEYTTSVAQGDMACGDVLLMIRGYGVCN